MNKPMVLALFGVLLLCAAAFILLGLPMFPEEPAAFPQSSGEGGYEMQYAPPEGINTLNSESPDTTSSFEQEAAPEDILAYSEEEPSQETFFSEESEAPEPEQNLCETLGLPEDKCTDDKETLTFTNLDDEEVSLDGISFVPDETYDKNNGKKSSSTRRKLVLSNIYDTQLTDLTFTGEGGEVTLKEVSISDIPGESELSQALILENNLLGVDSENYPELDRPARVKFVGIYGLKNVYPLKNGEPCGSDCSDFKYDAKTGRASMDVSGFSSYSIGGIEVINALHLDSSYALVSDITSSVLGKDSSWSEEIPVADFVRATFEQNLSNGKVIDVYARKGGASNVYFNIYPEGATSPLIGTSGPLTDSGGWVYITVQNLSGEEDTFDFQILGDSGGYAEFDYIHDVDVGGCTNISYPGYYVLTQNLAGAPFGLDFESSSLELDSACIIIESSDVILDCGIYNITNDGTTNATAIAINGSSSGVLQNITIANCSRIKDYKSGFSSEYSTQVELRDSNFSNNSYGAAIASTTSSLFTNLSMSEGGMQLYPGSDYNNITGLISVDSSGYSVYFEGSSHNRVIGLFSDGATFHGVQMQDESMDNLVKDSAIHNAIGYGIQIANSTATITNNLINNSGFSGIEIVGAGDVNISHNTIHGCLVGINSRTFNSFAVETHVFGENNTIYDSGDSALELDTDVYALHVNLTNTTLLPPSGTQEIYTVFDLHDDLANTDEYKIDWAPAASQYEAYPDLYIYATFHRKSINITTIDATPGTIDHIAWHWNSSEAAGYSEANLSILKINDSGYYVYPETPNLTANTLTIDNLALDSSASRRYGIYEHRLNCIEPSDDLYINESTYLCEGWYDITDAGAVGIVIFNNDSIDVVCLNNNVTINGTSTGTGFITNRDNTSLINCSIARYEYGITVKAEPSGAHIETHDVWLYGNRINHTDIGIYSRSDHLIYDCIYENNTIYNSTYGIEFTGYWETTDINRNNNITNNTIINATYGVHLPAKNTHHNTFTDNTFINMTDFAVYMALANNWLHKYPLNTRNEFGHANTINGSLFYHYYNHSDENIADLDLDASNQGTNLGLFTCVRCENILFKNNELDSAWNAGALFLGVSNLTVEHNNISNSNQYGAGYVWPFTDMWKCAGITVYNSTDPVVRFNYVDSSTFGIFMFGEDSTIPSNYNPLTHNNSIYNVSIGIEVKNNQEGRIINNTIWEASDAGIRLDGDDYTNVTDNLIYNSATGIHLFQDSDHNRVLDNEIYNMSTSGIRLRTTGVYVYGTPEYNTIENNTVINATEGIHMYDSRYNNFTTNDINDTTYGVHFEVTDTGVTPNNFVGNRFYNATGYAVYFDTSSWTTGSLNGLRNYFYCDNYYQGEIFCHFYNVHNTTFATYYGSAGYDGNATNDATDFGMITVLESSNFSMINMNLSHDREYGLVFIYSHNISITDSNLSDNGDAGYEANIRFHGSHDGLVQNTTLINSRYGIFLGTEWSPQESHYAHIYNNTIINASVHGIEVFGVDHTHIENNTLVDNPTHISTNKDMYHTRIIRNSMSGGEYGIGIHRDDGDDWAVRYMNITDNTAENMSEACYYIRANGNGNHEYEYLRLERNNCTNATYGYNLRLEDYRTYFRYNVFDTANFQDVDYGMYVYLHYYSTTNPMHIYDNNYSNFDINATIFPLLFRVNTGSTGYSMNHTLTNFTLRNDLSNDFYETEDPAITHINFTNVTFKRNLGAISFNYLNWNASNSITTANILLNNDIASINSTLHDYFQTEANVSLYTLNCPAGIYWKTGFPATALEIVTTGAACPGGRCYNEVCSSNLANFTVSNFSGYSTLEIHAPYVENVTLNSTWDINYTTENLTVYYDATDPDSGWVKNITNWFVNNETFMIANLPFEANSGNEGTSTRDYANGLNGTPVNSPTWLSDGGFDGWGTYNYTTGSDYMNISDVAPHIGGQDFTFTAWLKLDVTSGEDQYFFSTNGATVNANYMLFGRDNSPSNRFLIYYGSTSCNPGTFTFTPGKWHHITVVVDAANTQTLAYADGEYLGACGYTAIPTDARVSLALNHYYASSVSSEWGGPIDEVRIYNSTLTSGQIEMLYNNNTDSIHYTTTKQDDKWRACITPNDRLVDGTTNCSNNLTIIRFGVENVSIASSLGTNKSEENLTLSYDLFNGSETGIVNWYVDDVPLLNLYFPFEAYNGTDPAIAKDYSPQGFVGILTDVFWNSTAHNGRPGYTFDSATDSIRVDDSGMGVNSPLNKGKFTIEVWAKPSSLPSSGLNEMVSKAYSGGFGMGLTTNGRAYLSVAIGSTTQDSVYTSDNQVVADEWQHIVGTYDEDLGEIKLYINGTLNGTATYAGAYDISSGDFCIGERTLGTNACNGGSNFAGEIGTVRFWNRTFTAEQIQMLYNNVDPTEISSTETTYGDVWKSCVLAHGGWEDSLDPESCSNNITIETPLPPIVENVTLNSTLGTNYTNEDLTVWYDSFSPEGYDVKNMTTWFLTNISVTNKSIMTLLLPFEGWTDEERKRDYTSYEHNVTSVNSMTYYPNGGYDSWGVYGCQASTSVYMELNNSAMDGLDDFTIMMWVNKSSTTAMQAIISAAGSSSSNEFIFFTTPTSMRVYIRGAYDTFTGFDLGQNEWHHIAFKRTGSVGEFFVDGVSMGTATVSTATLNVGCPASTGLILCQEQDSCGGGFSAIQAWEGMVDDIQVFNISLTDEQVAAISNNLTDTIVSQETTVDDTWQACVRANDGVQASAQNCSNNLTITEPPVTCQIISSGGSYSLPTAATGAPLFVYGPPEATQACVVIASSNVEFSCNGYNIINDGTLDAAAIMLNGSAGTTYTNITIRDCPSISGYKQGIYIYDSTYITVENSTAQNSGQNGFFSSYSNYTTISNSMAYNNPYGIYLEYSEYANIEGTNATENIMYGMYLQSSNNSNVTNVDSYNNTLDGLYLNESYDVLIDPSKFKDNKANGINLNNCDGITLSDLTVTDNNANGIIANHATTIGLINVNVSGNNGHGLHMVQSSGITISQSTFCSNHQYGIRSQLGLNIQVSTSDICSNTDHGVHLISTSGTTLDDVEIFGNGETGVLVANSANTFVLDSHFYNNGYDIEVTETAATPSPFNLTKVIFDRPAGDYQSFTNLSINDTLDSYSYTINWSDDQPTEPSGYISFSQKYVNISTQAGVPSIDYISWKWSDAEIADYNQSAFGIWEHSAGVWTQLNDTPDIVAQVLSLYDLTPASGYGILQKNVTNITVQLNTPSNGHLTTLTTIIFTCTAASPQPMVNITLYGNWSGGWHENETKPLTGTYNSTTFTKTLPLGTYKWNCLAFDSIPEFDWEDVNFTFTIRNATDDVYALGGANVTVLNTSKYNGSDIGGTYELQGGNLTGADFNMRVSTEKWAGMYGNLTARLILSEGSDTIFMYAWNWTPNSGGEVCLTQNAGPFWTAMEPTQKSSIDTAFGFNPSDSDSANKSLTDASVLINVANVTSATTGVHLSANSTFEMGAFQFVSNATGEADFAFCVNLTDGKNYRNQSKHFELVVPTTEEKGPGPLETYYVYVELN